MSATRVLGIDPGTRVTGWGVVELQPGGARALAWGTLRLDPEAPIDVRLEAIHRGVAAVLGEHAPGAVAVEEAFMGRNVRAAIRLAEARAVCLLAARFAGREVHEVPPALVKKVLTGHGQAGKQTVREAVMRALGWTLPGAATEEARAPAYDASDALAIATCVVWRLGAPADLRGAGVGRRSGQGRPGRRGRWTLAEVERQQQEHQRRELGQRELQQRDHQPREAK